MSQYNSYGVEVSLLALTACALIYKFSPYIVYLYRLLNNYYIFILPILLILIAVIFAYKVFKQDKKNKKEFFLGFDNKKAVFISDKIRTTHAQVIGTTGSGKTQSVILPWIIQDIKDKKGVLIIDGKSDNSFLDKLYSYIVHFKRESNFKLFSLFNVEKSHSFNPLDGASNIEVAERVFSAFNFESQYYKNIQYKIFLNIVSAVKEREAPSFKLIHLLLNDIDKLSIYNQSCKSSQIKSAIENFISLEDEQREKRKSGLDAQLSHFATGDCSCLFENNKDNISINEALNKNQILYFQLPTMLYPTLASATGKLILQCLQSAVSRRHLESSSQKQFSVYLDDFQDYIYKGFAGLLNKSRSANVSMVFSHQSLGDLEKVSSSFADIVLTNTNLKVIMRLNDPKTCDYFAKCFGTRSSYKSTEQTDDGIFGKDKTGRGTIRKVEEYIFHPNEFKKMPIGMGIVNIPENDEVLYHKLYFPMLKNQKLQKLKSVNNLKINNKNDAIYKIAKRRDK